MSYCPACGSPVILVIIDSKRIRINRPGSQDSGYVRNPFCKEAIAVVTVHSTVSNTQADFIMGTLCLLVAYFINHFAYSRAYCMFINMFD